MNIIIRTSNFIGDTVMMLPALELIKKEYPNAKYTVVCKSHSVDIFRNKGIDKIIIDDTKGKNRFLKTIKLIKGLRKKRYELGVLFHNTFVDALIFKFLKVDKVIGYDNEFRAFLLDFSIKMDKNRHIVNHCANLVNSYFDNKYKTLPKMELVPQKQNLVKKEENRVVGFVLGSDKGYRGYPRDLSKELFKKLKEKKLSFDIVLLGDKFDAKSNKLYEDILKESNLTWHNLSGKTTVGEFIDIIHDLDILVTIDSSAMHIAAATNTKFITLIGFGTSAFDTVKPKVDFGSYIFKGKDCIRDSDMIREISPDDIIKEIENRLYNV